MVHKLFLPISLNLPCNLSLRRSGVNVRACLFINTKPESVMLSEIINRKLRWILVEDSFTPYFIFFCVPHGKEVPFILFGMNASILSGKYLQGGFCVSFHLLHACLQEGRNS